MLFAQPKAVGSFAYTRRVAPGACRRREARVPRVGRYEALRGRDVTDGGDQVAAALLDAAAPVILG